MHSEKILNLIKQLSNESADKEQMSKLLISFSDTTDPKKISESLVMLFSIVDTNHKKNKNVLVEILTILLSLNDKVTPINHSEQKTTNAKKETAKTSKSVIVDIVKASPIITIGSAVLFIFLVTFFIFNEIDPKATDETVHNIKDVSKTFIPTKKK